MNLVDLKCPNCNSTLEQEGENLVCPSCGAVFAIDYDDSDVEHERIKTEAELEEKRQEHEKEMLEREFELREQAEIRAEQRKAGNGHKYVNGKAGWAILIALIIIGCFSSYFAFQTFSRCKNTKNPERTQKASRDFVLCLSTVMPTSAVRTSCQGKRQRREARRTCPQRPDGRQRRSHQTTCSR